MTTVEDKMNLYKKLVQVQQTAQNIKESGWNDFSKYAYPLFSDIVDAIKPRLKEQNLFLHYNTVEYQAYRTSDGKKNVASLLLRATVVDADSYESLSVDCPGYAEDTSDKAIYQAQTNARKYAILSLFGLRVGEDQESNSNTRTKETKQTKSSHRKTQNNLNNQPSQESII